MRFIDSTSPKIAMLIARYWPAMGGSEQHTRVLSQHLAERHALQVAYVRTTETEATDVSYAWNTKQSGRDGDVRLTQLSAPDGAGRRLMQRLSPGGQPGTRLARGLFSRMARLSLGPQLRELTGDSDLIHLTYNGFTPLAQAAADLGKPFVFTPLAHTTLPEGTGWSSPGMCALYRKANALIAMTGYEKEWLIDHGAREERVFVVPMAAMLDAEEALSEEAFRQEAGLGTHPFIFFLGRRTTAKGLPALLEAMPRVWKEYPQLRLVVAGPKEAQLPERLISIMADDRVIDHGLISGSAKLAALKNCQALCVPSSEESLGVIYLEAWSQGRPVIAANTPVMQTVVADGQDGLLCEQTASSIAQAVVELLDNPANATQMGRAGFNKVEAGYSWERSAEKLGEIYRQVLAGT